MEKINLRLKMLRKEKQYTQKQVMDISGLTVGTYQSYEYQTAEPSLEKLIVFSELYDVSIEYLIGISEQRTFPQQFDKSNNTSFPSRLKVLRKENHMTQEQIAALIHKSMRTYRRYESGKNEPSLSVLVELAALFHTSVDYLCGRNFL